MNEMTMMSAFGIGLLGSVHCIGMCGGIVAVLALGLSPEVRVSTRRIIPFLVCYNLGRIVSYATAGALVAAAGAALIERLPNPANVSLYISGGFMIALGLYLGEWWRGLARLEKAGGWLWRRIEPLGRRLLPVRNLFHAFGLGLAWGWLPCGLVYAALGLAFGSGGAARGALVMLSFGAGTLPMLLTLGAVSERLGTWVKSRAVRGGAGAVIMGLGMATLAGALAGNF